MFQKDSVYCKLLSSPKSLHSAVSSYLCFFFNKWGKYRSRVSVPPVKSNPAWSHASNGRCVQSHLLVSDIGMEYRSSKLSFPSCPLWSLPGLRWIKAALGSMRLMVDIEDQVWCSCTSTWHLSWFREGTQVSADRMRWLCPRGPFWASTAQGASQKIRNLGQSQIHRWRESTLFFHLSKLKRPWVWVSLSGASSLVEW